MKFKNTLSLLSLCMIATSVFSQNYIRFSNKPIAENDLSKVASVANFKAADPIYISFEMHDIEKMNLHEHEAIMIKMKFFEGAQSISEYSMMATQDNNGVVRGQGVILPPSSNDAEFEVNTIYSDDFHNAFLYDYKNKSQKQKKSTIYVEEFYVSVYDFLKGSCIRIDYGVDSENESRFPQFANKMIPNFKLKKNASLTMEFSKDYPYMEIMEKCNAQAKATKKRMYTNVTNKIKAPAEYLSNNFKGFEGEISREQAEVLIKDFFSNTNYTATHINEYSNSVRVARDQRGEPTYKFCNVGFYATKADGGCAYGMVTISANFNGVSYEGWKIYTHQINNCVCE